MLESILSLNTSTQLTHGKLYTCMFLILTYSIDDIEDNSILRRGVPVAHSIYGVASTINAANYALFLALEKVQQLDHPEVRKSTSTMELKVIRVSCRPPRCTPNNCWSCTVDRAWRYIGATASRVPPSRITS